MNPQRVETSTVAGRPQGGHLVIEHTGVHPKIEILPKVSSSCCQKTQKYQKGL